MPILILLKRNIQHKKGTFISIFILMCILTMALVSITSTYDNQVESLETSMERANTGDLMSMIKEVDFDKDILEKLQKSRDAKRVEDIPSIALYNVKINKKESSNMLMAIPFDNISSQYRLANKEATTFEKQKGSLEKGEIYLPLGMKQLFNCNIDDTITITTNIDEKKFVLKGFVEEPMLGAYFIGVKQVFVCDEDFNSLKEILETTPTVQGRKPTMEKYHIIHVYKANTTLSDIGFQKIINEQTSILDYARLTLTQTASMNYTLMANNVINGILYAFIILLVIIVMVVIGHNITMSMEMDFVDLGILKAQGVTNNIIQIVFVIQYISAILLGCIVGFILAIPSLEYWDIYFNR